MFMSPYFFFFPFDVRDHSTSEEGRALMGLENGSTRVCHTRVSLSSFVKPALEANGSGLPVAPGKTMKLILV